MDVPPHWNTICDVVERALKTKGFCAMATVNPDGSPHVTPIGSLFLHSPGKAYYFEKFPKKMRRNLDQDQRICVLAVHGGFWCSMASLFRGRFDTAPGVRLMGRAGEQRPATEEEERRWRERIKVFRWLKGYDLLWGEMTHVRDICFDSFEPVSVGLMTKGLWGDMEPRETHSR
ncbi:pyridoxamine 5'-phosphate oxidase family protein [Desulfolutivibrio sulfoxidireducens]|uniref:pyridoxamine 5'-phosphate oxidase family protein n=1 Tax=Desulfolutivibrio sulfoxidireducens TaxID=2773299 RepID=UPI00159DBB00|nr:pyridoxamine 5'-phosphate oxidase family protein [Desulfolutivibrio sulfoxidireducens]QLA17783.1 pyridoxamine 5'-phosphate oxidase family protein [Desulfolutivibrio sulfoxidireducens]QLA21361.1 pyridoxamine 5'-phosphate oxidase family protein [Desulfolutivibrio sulfoxidireducens]